MRHLAMFFRVYKGRYKMDSKSAYRLARYAFIHKLPIHEAYQRWDRGEVPGKPQAVTQ